MTKRSIRLSLLLALSVVPNIAFAASDPRAFIQELGDKTVATMSTTGAASTDREQRFATMFRNDFDIPALARSALGQYWRTATPQEQQEYVSVFQDYIVQTYASRFGKYYGQQFQTTGQQEGGNGTTIVSSEVSYPNTGYAPSKVSWTVGGTPPNYKIQDISIQGISMRISQRDEFNAYISKHGGNVQELIKALREKIADH